MRVQLGQPPAHHTQVEPDAREFLPEQFHGSLVELGEREARARGAECDKLLLGGEERAVEVCLCGGEAA